MWFLEPTCVLPLPALATRPPGVAQHYYGWGGLQSPGPTGCFFATHPPAAPGEEPPLTERLIVRSPGWQRKAAQQRTRRAGRDGAKLGQLLQGGGPRVSPATACSYCFSVSIPRWDYHLVFAKCFQYVSNPSVLLETRADVTRCPSLWDGVD